MAMMSGMNPMMAMMERGASFHCLRIEGKALSCDPLRAMPDSLPGSVLRATWSLPDSLGMICPREWRGSNDGHGLGGASGTGTGPCSDLD